MIEGNRKRKEKFWEFEPWKDFYRKAEVQCHGKKFVVRSYGFCYWSRVILLWGDDQEFYRLTRNMKTWFEKKDKSTLRSEYFNGRLIRRYVGPQNCFVEFFDFLQKRSSCPTQREFAEASRSLKLDKKITIKYMEFYQQCFLT